MKKQILLHLLLLLPLMVASETIQTETNGILYNIETDNQTATVTSPNDGEKCAGDIFIPDTIVYNDIIYKVIGIESYAFSNCDRMESVTIGSNVEYIGECAFNNNSYIDTLTILSAAPPVVYWNSFSSYGQVFVPRQAVQGYRMDSYWKEWWRIRVIPTLIDGLFYELYDEPRHAVVVERMGGPTVDGYSGNINIPEQVEDDGIVYPVTSIGESAFDCCTMLNAITIPKSISTIGPNAFMSCEGLTSIVVDADNQTFDSRENCNAIIESSTGMLLFGSNASTIPEGVTAIADNAFRNCMMLSSLRIPSTLLSLGKLSFSGSGIRAISVAEGNPKFDSRDGCNAIIETATNTLFLGCSTTVIPPTVKVIGSYAFRTTRDLEEIVIPEGVEEIKESAFTYNTKVKEIRLPSTLKSVGSMAFYGLTNLETIYLTKQLQSLTDMIFTGSDHLSDVYCYSEIVPEAGDYCFGDFHGNMMPYSNDNMVNATLHVPGLSIEHYSSQSPWSLFGSIVSIQKYTLQYKAGDEIMASLNYYEGEPIDIGSRPQKDGYTYQCPETPAYMPHEDVTINGLFVANKYHLTYIVDGETYKAIEMAYGDMITTEPSPTKEGFSFSGWDGLPTTMPAHDIIITGTFSVNTYTLTYELDGEPYKTVDVEYSKNIIAEAEPSKEGYTFVGWDGLPMTMPAYDVTVTGSFKANQYTITYMIDGEFYETAKANYGSTIPSVPTPTKDGYTFSGWGAYPSTMPANDITINGTFVANKYKLIYEVDDNVYKIVEVIFGKNIVAEAKPSKEGYTFVGWNGLPTTMPASDVTVTGSFLVNQYTITYVIDGEVYKTVVVDFGSMIVPPVSESDEYRFVWGSHPTTMPAYDITVNGTSFATGIRGINNGEDEVRMYTVDGRRQEKPKKGLVIVRDAKGRSKKFFVK